MEDWFKGRWENINPKRKDELRKKYSIKVKGFKTIFDELKQKITAKAEEPKRYKTRVTQYR